MGVYFRRTPLLSCTLNFRHLLRRLMFDGWGELIEASIVTKHIIQRDLSVKGEIKRKKQKVEQEEEHRGSNK